MMQFMREGGFNMWLMVLTAAGVAVLAAVRGRRAMPTVLAAGCAAVGLEGMLGMAMGMKAVAAYCAAVGTSEKVDALAMGLGELANNGLLAVPLAAALGLAALVTRTAASSRPGTAPVAAQG